jgi:Cys-tRNA(Pro)/Cys-tRNA(Cys) deacylase
MSPQVRRFLQDKGLAFELIEHAPLISFEDAQRLLPHDPALMVKSLVFQAPDDGLTIIALRAGDKADYKRIADALGLRRAALQWADAQQVQSRLDMEPGGIVPLPLNGATVLIDTAVAGLPTIICGTGRNTATLIIAREAWQQASGGRLADLAKRPA